MALFSDADGIRAQHGSPTRWQPERNPPHERSEHPEGEPWQWPEETWRAIVGRARAGRSLKPTAWPDGARCAVAISFDADHETIPLRDNDESPMRISQGQYGARQAMPRIRKLLERESVPGDVLLSRRVGAAASGGGARRGRRRARDRHPFVDPRSQHDPAARGRTRTDVPRRARRWRRSAAASRSACAPRAGISRSTRWTSSAK